MMVKNVGYAIAILFMQYTILAQICLSNILGSREEKSRKEVTQNSNICTTYIVFKSRDSDNFSTFLYSTLFT